MILILLALFAITIVIVGPIGLEISHPADNTDKELSPTISITYTRSIL